MANIDLEKLSPVGFKNAETLVALDSNEDVIRVTPPEDYYTEEEIDGKLSEIRDGLTGLEGRVSQAEQNIIGNTASINDLTSSVNSITTNISTITSDMTSIKLDVNQNKIDIADLKRTVSGNDTDISSLEGRVTVNEQNISLHTEKIEDLDNRVILLEGDRQDLSGLAAQVEQNKAGIETHDERIGTLESRVDVHEANIAENTSDIEQHRNDIQTINGNITIINRNVSDIQSEIPRIKKGIHKNSTDIAALDDRLTTDEEVIETNTERIEALEEGLVANEIQTGKNDERLQVLEELIQTDGDGTHYLSDDGTYKELIVEKDLFSTHILYVNSSFEGESNGSVYAPFASLQAAVDSTTAGRSYQIRLSVDTFAENLVIHEGHGLLQIEGVGITGYSETILEGDLAVSARNQNGRVLLKNLRVSGTVTVSDSAQVYMENVLFDKPVVISGQGGYQRYGHCVWNGLTVNGTNRVDVRNGEEQSNSEWVLNSSSSQLSVVDCTGFMVRHTGGIYYLMGYSRLGTDIDGYSVYSTAMEADGSSLRMMNCDLLQEEGFTGSIMKTGDCPYYLGTSIYEQMDSVLEGIRLDGGLYADQVFDYQSRIGYTAVDSSLAGHLDGISIRLDELSHGGPSIVDKVEILPESYVDITVASARTVQGQLYNTGAATYTTYVKQLGGNLRNPEFFGENGLVKNYPYTNFKQQTVPDETVDFYAPNYISISAVQGTAIRNWLHGDDKRIMFTLTDAYASAFFSNLGIDGYVGASNAAAASTNRTPGTNTAIDLSSKEITLQNKVYDYIFRSGEFTGGFEIDPAAVSLRSANATNQSISAWPDTFIPLIYSTRYSARCILGIDPVNRIIFCGDMDMFSNTNNCFTSGANAEANMKFLNNILAFATNVCKYGEAFTRYFTDATPVRGIYNVCLENTSALSLPQALDMLTGDGQYYYELAPGTLITSEVVTNNVLYGIGVVFKDLKLVPPVNNSEIEMENVKAVNLTVSNGDYSVSSLLLNNVQVDQLNITEIANAGIFGVSAYSADTTPVAMIAPVRYATINNLEIPEGEVIISLADDAEQQVIAQNVNAASLTIRSTSETGEMSVELYNIHTNSVVVENTLLDEMLFTNGSPGSFRTLSFLQVTFLAGACEELVDALIESETALESLSFEECTGVTVTAGQQEALETKGIVVHGL